MTTKYVCLILIALLSVCLGCYPELPPTMYSTNYGSVSVSPNVFPHKGGQQLTLYRFEESHQRRLIWPALVIRENAVLDDLILFNGVNGDRGTESSGILPFFGYAGKGQVVELSRPLGRKVALLAAGVTNFSFSINSSSNTLVTLRASQCPPPYRVQPIHIIVNATKDEILQYISDAQTNGVQNKYKSVSYIIAN